MRIQWVPLCFSLLGLIGCSNYEQNTSLETFPHNPKSSSPCRAIKQQLNAIAAPQIPANSVYPPQTGPYSTAIQKARLMKDYEYYGCQN